MKACYWGLVQVGCVGMFAALARTYLSTLLFFLFICSRTHLWNTCSTADHVRPSWRPGMEQWGIRRQSLPLWNFILMGVGHWWRGHRQHGVLRTSAERSEFSSRTTILIWRLLDFISVWAQAPSAWHTVLLQCPCHASLPVSSFPLLLMLWDLFPRHPLVCVPALAFPHVAHCQNHREPCKPNPVSLKELTWNKPWKCLRQKVHPV